MSGVLLGNSLLLAGGTAVSAVALGLVSALGYLFLPGRLRGPALAVAAAALVMPPFLVANTWLHYMGWNGPWREWLPWDVHSIAGAMILLTLLLWPMGFLLALASWKAVDKALLEAEPALGGTALIRWLLGPLAWPYLKLALAFTFVLALNNFTIPAILQVKVLPAALWVSFNTTFEYQTALAQGWPLVVIPLLLLLFLFPKRPLAPWQAELNTIPGPLWRERLGPAWGWAGLGILALLTLLSVGLPLSQLVFSRRTWSEIPAVLHASPEPLWNSFLFAFLAAAGCLTGALWIRRGRRLFLLWLPFLVPGIVLGILFIHLGNRPALHWVYPSVGLVIFSWILRYQAFTWQGLRMAQERADPDLEDAARLAGARGFMLWRTVHWPNLAPLGGATAYLTYLFCLWDVETLILLVPPGGETLALRVFNLLHYGHNAQVNAMCLLLLVMALLPLLCWKTGAWLTSRLFRIVS